MNLEIESLQGSEGATPPGWPRVSPLGRAASAAVGPVRAVVADAGSPREVPRSIWVTGDSRYKSLEQILLIYI